MAREPINEGRRPQTCPVCGEPVTSAETGELVRAWPGKYAHAHCASYGRRHGARERRGSHRLHRKFTRT